MDLGGFVLPLQGEKSGRFTENDVKEEEESGFSRFPSKMKFATVKIFLRTT